MENINFNDFKFEDLINSGCIGAFYEKIPPIRKYRDTVTFYIDGKIRFVRYCYGEAAGPIVELWSVGSIGNDGAITWDYEKASYSRKEETPNKLFATDENGSLYFNDEKYPWELKENLKTDPERGYGMFKALFNKKK